MSGEYNESEELTKRSQQLAQELLEAMQRPGDDPERALYEAQKEREDREALADYYRRTGQLPDTTPHSETVSASSPGNSGVLGPNSPSIVSTKPEEL